MKPADTNLQTAGYSIKFPTVPDVAADFFEVILHGLGIGPWHHQSCSDAPARTDRAERVGVAVSLVGGLAGASSFLRPLSDLPVLLTKPRIRWEMIPRIISDPPHSWNQISTGVPAGSSAVLAASVSAKFF